MTRDYLVVVETEMTEDVLFRRSWWGMTMDEVLAIESANLDPDRRDPQELWYRSTLAGAPCDIIYQFDERGSLSTGVYLISGAPGVVIHTHADLERMLRKKYGEPHDVEEEWAYPNRRRPLRAVYDVAEAIASGELSLAHRWLFERRVLRLQLDRLQDGDLGVFLSYFDRATLARGSRLDSELEADLDLI